MSLALTRTFGRLGLWAGILAFSAIATDAAEPSIYEYSETPPGPSYQPIPPYPVEMGFSQHHSSTYSEGVQRGRAALIQAWGNYALSWNQALILNEHARWLHRINEFEEARAWQGRRAFAKEIREREREEKAARRVSGQAKVAVRRQTLYSLVYQLDPDQLDRKSGRIYWPVTLEQSNLAELRQRVDGLFRELVAYGEPNRETAQQIARATRRMKIELQRQISDLPRDEYSAAQKFLLGVEYAAESVAPPAATGSSPLLASHNHPRQ